MKITIPPESMEAAARAYSDAAAYGSTENAWNAALVAAIAAWPGADKYQNEEMEKPWLILPLQQEKRDE